MTGIDIITLALAEIRVTRAGDVPEPESVELGRLVLNRILDTWNADERAVYATGYVDYTLTGALSPHTIGPTGTFVVAQRPVSIEAILLNLGSNVFSTITLRDAQWYAEQLSPALSDTSPSDFYYQPNWPNGSIYFWPVPSSALSVRLWSRYVLTDLDNADLASEFSLPPGYLGALSLTLAEELASPFGQAVSQMTVQKAAKTRAQCFSNNSRPPRLNTTDFGVPGESGGGSFDYRTGLAE